MLEGAKGVGVAAAVVGVVRAVVAFVTDDGVEGADLERQTIADGDVQGDVALSEGDAARATSANGVAEDGRIRTHPELGHVTSGPLALIQRLADGELDHIQVETITLAGEIGRTGTSGEASGLTGIPVSRGADIATDLSGRDGRENLIRRLFFRLSNRAEADHACGGQPECPLIDFHVVLFLLRVVDCLVTFFVLLANKTGLFAHQKRCISCG